MKVSGATARGAALTVSLAESPPARAMCPEA